MGDFIEGGRGPVRFGRQPDDPGDSGYPPRSGGGLIIFLCYFSICLSIVGLVFIAWVLLTPASAHEAGPLTPVQAFPQINQPSQENGQPLGWKYGWECCSGTDCAEIPDNAVHETPGGYTVDGSADEAPISYNDPKRIKQSKDEHFHWCAHRAGADLNKTICLYVPAKGY